MSAPMAAAIAAIVAEQSVVTTAQVVTAVTDHFGPGHFLTQEHASGILKELGWKETSGRQPNSTAIVPIYRAPAEGRS